MAERTKMLRSLIIMGKSGIVVFEKSWDKQETVSQKWGGLISSILEFSVQSVGYPVSYFETPSAALSITTDQKTGVICAIIHSNEDSNEFGQLIAKEILRTFLETYPLADYNGLQKSQFAGFGAKIVDCIKRVADSILHNLSAIDGIEASLLVYDDGTESISAGTLEDNFSVIANFRALLRVACQLMQEQKQDAPDFMLLEMGERLVYVHRINATASLVTLCVRKRRTSDVSEIDYKNEPSIEQYYSIICRHQKLLNRVFMLGSYFTSVK